MIEGAVHICFDVFFLLACVLLCSRSKRTYLVVFLIVWISGCQSACTMTLLALAFFCKRWCTCIDELSNHVATAH